MPASAGDDVAHSNGSAACHLSTNLAPIYKSKGYCSRMSFQNEIEEAVFRLCKRTFLSLWSYANPRRHGSTKELCDVLVLCEPHIILFSVKHCELNTTKPLEVAANRWLRKAIRQSADQLYGAERDLTMADTVTRADGSPGLPLPPLNERLIHRVSVSLGSQGLLPVPSADLGKGFVHVFEEEFLNIALQELDTISDFVGYLAAKEELCAQHQGLVVEGGEKNLLAVYLNHNRNFPEEHPPPVIPGNTWAKLAGSEAYCRKQEADELSYGWDRLLEFLAGEVLADRMDGLRGIEILEFSNSLSDHERILRYMARENRFARRGLTKLLVSFRELALESKVQARLAPSDSGVTYLFYNPPPEHGREERMQDLSLRSYVARNEVSGCETVVGLGMNVQPAAQGFAVDLCLLEAPDWTEEDKEKAEGIKQDLGYFKAPVNKQMQLHEYPSEKDV